MVIAILIIIALFFAVITFIFGFIPLWSASISFLDSLSFIPDFMNTGNFWAWVLSLIALAMAIGIVQTGIKVINAIIPFGQFILFVLGIVTFFLFREDIISTLSSYNSFYEGAGFWKNTILLFTLIGIIFPSSKSKSEE